MNDEIQQWADVFPHIKNAATSDPRIFETPWEKIDESKNSGKKKTYFACVVGKDCYGVEIVKPWAAHAKNECQNAFAKMKRAVYYYEENGEWPK